MDSRSGTGLHINAYAAAPGSPAGPPADGNGRPAEDPTAAIDDNAPGHRRDKASSPKDPTTRSKGI